MSKAYSDYCVDNNIEIVRGALNSCIHNLNTGKIYSVNDRFLTQFELIKNKRTSLIQADVIERLIAERILVQINNVTPQYCCSDKIQGVEFAWIEITKRCNLRCIHCYEDSSGQAMLQDMQFGLFKQIIDGLAEQKIWSIQLIGGEPFLHDDVVAMIEYCKGKFDYVEIFTNGTLLNNMYLETIKDSNIHLALSVYSNTSEIHDGVTCIEGSHLKTMTHLRKIAAFGISHRIASIEMKDAPAFELACEESNQKIDMPRLTGRAANGGKSLKVGGNTYTATDTGLYCRNATSKVVSLCVSNAVSNLNYHDGKIYYTHIANDTTQFCAYNTETGTNVVLFEEQSSAVQMYLVCGTHILYMNADGVFAYDLMLNQKTNV